MYYNQRKYGHVPYPHKAHPDATVKTSGCGVVCASMIVEALTDASLPPDKAAEFAIACGARASTGTNMRVLAPALAASYNLKYKSTNSRADLVHCLENGGTAIANIGGDRKGYKATFCTTGHYVTIMGIAKDDRLIVYDPDYYAGKFTINGRGSKVELHLPSILCSAYTMEQDTQNRDPRYYLFWKEKKQEPTAADRICEALENLINVIREVSK